MNDNLLLEGIGIDDNTIVATEAIVFYDFPPKIICKGKTKVALPIGKAPFFMGKYSYFGVLRLKAEGVIPVLFLNCEER